MSPHDRMAPPGLEFPAQVAWWHERADGSRHLHAVCFEDVKSVAFLMLRCPHRALLPDQQVWQGMRLPGCPGCGSVFLYGPPMGADERRRSRPFPECPSPPRDGGST